MEKGILSQVIEVEKEIQKSLELEKRKAKEWLESAKEKCEKDYLREEEEIKGSLEKSLEEATKQAEAKADEIVSAASFAAARLRELDTKSLQSLIEKMIAGILPR